MYVHIAKFVTDADMIMLNAKFYHRNTPIQDKCN